MLHTLKWVFTLRANARFAGGTSSLTHDRVWPNELARKGFERKNRVGMGDDRGQVLTRSMMSLILSFDSLC